ncbi:diacylglycerol/lipid kinase family protein [Flavobacterium sp. 3HN19-14]|uniref:diacylglycerol/lipid kinase family protein n=1 Tax=Flavobacterium sp. 3HN19-14 TaxID=3448133 RepID=UPI003EE27F32
MNAQKKYIFVVNPISGDVDKTEMISAVEAYAEETGIKIVTFETTGENDESALKNLFEKHRPHRVLIAGGDGTIKMAGEALQHQDVIFGIIPAGSANGLSVDLNLPATIAENLPIAFHSDAMEIDMISINNKKACI